MWKSKFGLSNGGTDKRPGGDVGSKSAGKGGEPAAPPTPGNENGRGERSKKSGEFHDWRLDSNFDSSLTTTRDLDDLMNTLAVSPPPPPSVSSFNLLSVDLSAMVLLLFSYDRQMTRSKLLFKVWGGGMR